MSREHIVLIAPVPALGALDLAALRVQGRLLRATRIKFHFEMGQGSYNWSFPLSALTPAKLAELEPRARGYQLVRVSVGDASL